MALGSAAVLMTALMFIIPMADPSLSLISTSVSELGAQDSTFGWLMNGSMILLSVVSVVAGWNFFEGFIFHRGILVLFGISLVLMSVFRDAPAAPGFFYSMTEAGWHEYFVFTTMLSFIIMVFTTAFTHGGERSRTISVITGFSVILLVLLIAETDKADGICQRLFFVILQVWMILNFRT